MNRKAFFEVVDNGLVEVNNKAQFQKAWKRLSEYEANNKFNLDEPHKRTEYVAMFSSFGARSQGLFRYEKLTLLTYLDYLSSNSVFPVSVVDEVRSIMFRELQTTKAKKMIYYKSVNHLIEFIQMTMIKSDYYPEFFRDENEDKGNPYLSAACYLILAWYGLSVEEILDLRTYDVLDECVSVNGREVFIDDERALYLLTAYKRSTGVYRGNGTSEFYFAPYKQGSDYLFRTCKSDRFTESSIKNRASLLDRISNKEFGFSHSSAYVSGLFNRAFKVECNTIKELHPIENKDDFTLLFGYEVPDMRNRKPIVEQYKNYKQIYH